MVKLQFHGTKYCIENTYLEVNANLKNEISISINNLDNELENSYISLDKETAIKLSKELRKQISLI
jgi:hypothetical protein